jgi:cardiolipin synthase A/B
VHGAVRSSVMADDTKMKRVLETVLGRPITEGNQVEILRNGHEIFPSMLEAIGKAERSIEFLTFIYWTGNIGRIFAEAMAERAQAGVRVRVLLDAMGAWRLDTDIPEIMSNAGCDVRWFRPVDSKDALHANNRTHRKVMVVDEAVGFTGGVGIADEWDGDARDEAEWRDTHFRVVGPALDGLRAAFLDNWAETGSDLIDYEVDQFPIAPRDGSLDVQVVLGMAEAGNSDIWNLFRVLIDCAESELRIATAYFTPDDEIMDRLCDAANRGVRVQIMVPGPHADKRFVQVASEKEYDRLLGCGIELHSFQPSMLHAKIMLIDGIMSVVGSANFNKRSTEHDDEVVMVVFDEGFTAELGRHYDEDLERCVDLDPDRWEDRGALQRLQERLADAIDGWL